jgi:hypothetical protein
MSYQLNREEAEAAPPTFETLKMGEASKQQGLVSWGVIFEGEAVKQEAPIRGVRGFSGSHSPAGRTFWWAVGWVAHETSLNLNLPKALVALGVTPKRAWGIMLLLAASGSLQARP